MPRYRDTQTGEILDQAQFDALSSGGSPATVTPKATGSNFTQRLKLGFGGEKSRAEGRRIEEEAGLRGSFDVGDIADVAGASLPLIGGVLGGIGASPTALASGPVGPTAGAAIGTAAGESLRRGIGSALGVRDEETKGGEIGGIVKDVAKSGVYTYLAGKTLETIAKIPPVKKALEVVTQKIPERLYSTFFKTSSDDLSKQIRTGAMAKLQAENPELFANYVKQGIVRPGPSGVVEINPTLARQALDKAFGSGKTGRSLEKMAEYSYLKQFEMESAARNIVKNTGAKVNIGGDKKGYLKLLDDSLKTFKKEGYGFLSREAGEAKLLHKELSAVKSSKIPADLALRIRRTLDTFRSASSFRQSTTLGPKQAIFKTAADKLRGRLANEVPGLKETMKEYKFYIDTADNLVAEAAKKGNTRIFSLFDAIVGGSSLSGDVPGTGLGLLAGLRTIQTPAILTFIARTLNQAPEVVSKIAPTAVGQATQKFTQK